VVSQRAAPMLLRYPAPGAVVHGELERAVARRALEILPDLPWPVTVTAPALAFAQDAPLGSRAGVAAWRVALRAEGSEAARAWLRAFRRALAEGKPGLEDSLRWLPASAIPLVFDAVDRGELSWQQALPALSSWLQRRATQAPVTAALRQRRAQLAQRLAPVEAQQLIQAAALCSRQHAADLADALTDLLAALPRSKRIIEAAAAAADRCVAVRSLYGAQLHLALQKLSGIPR
jgi:hypothetical protein